MRRPSDKEVQASIVQTVLAVLCVGALLAYLPAFGWLYDSRAESLRGFAASAGLVLSGFLAGILLLVGSIIAVAKAGAALETLGSNEDEDEEDDDE